MSPKNARKAEPSNTKPGVDYFKLGENRESFATMAYIIFVQTVVLGAAGMNSGAVSHDNRADAAHVQHNRRGSLRFYSLRAVKDRDGRAREAHYLVYIFAALFVMRYAIPGMH
jgi:hypothetical protein